MNENESKTQLCPICFQGFTVDEIETHANKCIFFNCNEQEQKRKRFLSVPEKATQCRSQKNGSPNKKQKTAIHVSNFFQPQTETDSKPSLNLLTNLLNESKDESYDSSNKEETSTSNTNNVLSNLINNNAMSFTTPLANQVQPKLLDDFFGQNHVLGKDSVLRSLLGKGEVPNMILWGPPGCGKTSLSKVIQEICKQNSRKLKFASLCAATSGVKDVQKIVSLSKADLKYGQKTVLFMDEIHRFNKRQQDVFLLSVERGDIILVGATTENPSFSINSALLSRCRVIVMEKLQTDDLVSILMRALNHLQIEVVNLEEDAFAELNKLSIDESAITWLADTCDGDARIALGNLQLVLQHNNSLNKLITVDVIKDGIKKSHLLYDRKGEEHYNVISAMHKSIRGSDVNAALYWTTRMIMSGEDPLFIARRLVRAASEDIGNADPNALQLAVAMMQGCQLIGMPEADVLLAQCAIYLARAPKSREADSALAAAKRTIAECRGIQPSVPMHLRNAPTKLMKDLGYGKPANGKQTSFMPAGLENVKFF